VLDPVVIIIFVHAFIIRLNVIQIDVKIASTVNQSKKKITVLIKEYISNKQLELLSEIP